MSASIEPVRDLTQGRPAAWSSAQLLHIGLSTCGIVAVGQPCDIVMRTDSQLAIGQLAFTLSADPRMFRLHSVRRGDSDGDQGTTFITQGTPGSGEFIIRLGPRAGTVTTGTAPWRRCSSKRSRPEP